jgi:hypothetical protein
LRAYLAYTLGRLGDQQIRTELQQIIHAEVNPELLRWSTLGLAMLGDVSARTILQKQYQNPHGGSQVRKAAIYATGLIGGKDSVKFLADVFRDENENILVRTYAVYALGMICDIRQEPTPSLYARDHNYMLDLSFIPELYLQF